MQSTKVGSFQTELCVMLSVAKLTPGQEHYESSVAQGLDGYYAGRGESALAAESGGSDWM